MPRRVAGLFLLLAATMARGETPVIVSAAPDKVAVTFYRDPGRSAWSEMDKDDPRSIALIAETRTVTLPPGVSTIRFEGVAGGILPQSAILFGTPPRERNRDALLLSKGGLVDAFTGQQVTLRHTDKATGKIVEEHATIRSAAERLVISTSRGAEAVYCSGLNQTLLYPNVPAGLSPKPVLSMTTRDQPGGTVTITLAYIANGFDWDATYVGTLAPNGKSLELLAWLTMASADETSFPDATLAAVAGRIQRSDESEDDDDWELADSLAQEVPCWPAATTSGPFDSGPIVAPAPIVAAPMAVAFDVGEIVVTSMRRQETFSSPAPVAVTARVENLGDLKLYRVPVPITVAARSQKQIAFLGGKTVKGGLLYRSRISGGSAPDDLEHIFRFRNSKARGLGEPLPAGKTVLYQQSPHGRQLIGESWTADKTNDEDVDYKLGAPADVTVEYREGEANGGDDVHHLTLRNATPFAVPYELEFQQQPYLEFRKLPGRTTAKPGKRVWATTLAANSERKISYVTRRIERPVEENKEDEE